MFWVLKTADAVLVVLHYVFHSFDVAAKFNAQTLDLFYDLGHALLYGNAHSRVFDA
jgi:hypothetical protein